MPPAESDAAPLIGEYTPAIPDLGALVDAVHAAQVTGLAESHRKLSEGFEAKADALREQLQERSEA